MKDWIPFAVAVTLPIVLVFGIFALAGPKGGNTIDANSNLKDNINETADKYLGPVSGKPKIWFCDRVLVVKKEGVRLPENVLRSFLDPEADLSSLGRPTEPVPVYYVCFDHAVEGNGWVIEWGMRYCDTGEPVESKCSEPVACGAYFTSIGCPHCAAVNPWLFHEFVPTHPVVIVEYEISRSGAANQRVFERYVKEYGTIPGVPQIIFDRKNVIVGDVDILRELNNIALEELNGACPVGWLKNIITAAGQTT